VDATSEECRAATGIPNAKRGAHSESRGEHRADQGAWSYTFGTELSHRWSDETPGFAAPDRSGCALFGWRRLSARATGGAGGSVFLQLPGSI